MDRKLCLHVDFSSLLCEACATKTHAQLELLQAMRYEAPDARTFTIRTATRVTLQMCQSAQSCKRAAVILRPPPRPVSARCHVQSTAGSCRSAEPSAVSACHCCQPVKSCRHWASCPCQLTWSARLMQHCSAFLDHLQTPQLSLLWQCLLAKHSVSG